MKLIEDARQRTNNDELFLSSREDFIEAVRIWCASPGRRWLFLSSREDFIEAFWFVRGLGADCVVIPLIKRGLH